MSRRSCCVHTPKKPSCFHRLRISFFFSSTRSSFPCLKVAVSYKSGRICIQLPFSVPQFNLCRSLYSLSPTSFIVFASRFFFPPSTRSSFPCPRVAVSYKPGRISAQLPLSAPRFHLRRSLYSLISPFFHRLRILLYFSSTLSSITASFRRLFHRYINDLAFSCAVGSSQEPPSPVHALY